jgi:integrase
MRGSLRKRGNSWQLRVFLGVDETTGKKTYTNKTIHGTKKEAERELNRIVREVDTGGFVEPENITVGAYLQRWLKDYVQTSGRAEWTRRTYSSIVTKHLIPAFGRVQLQRLTPAMLQHYYATKRENGSLGNAWLAAGQPLSATTVAHHHAVIHEALEHAVKQGVIARNVADAVEPPKIKRQGSEVWSVEDVQRFLAHAKENRYYALFLAAITTGMRQGELLGLRWQDVDLDAGIASIRQTMHKAGKNPVFGTPKTDRSRRRVVLLPEPVRALRVLQVAQAADRHEAGETYRDYGLVFTVPGGAPISAANLLKRGFRPLIERADVPTIRFHDLRHSHATLLLRNGVHPKIVSERLGHASITITLDTYSHVLPDMQQEAVAGLQQRLFAGSEARL